MRLIHGDCIWEMSAMSDNSVDSIVTDPPYELGFMGKGWDKTGIANSVELWWHCHRILKPGGHLLAFSGSRTYHRMVCAIEDAGFDIRDQIMWLYGSGFPKSHDVSKGIDKAAGVEREVVGFYESPEGTTGWNGQASRSIYSGASQHADGERRSITAPATDAARQWQGWGTALKPAHEPIVLARKPLAEPTVAANVLKHGTGAINVDGCRVSHVTVQGGSLALNPHLRDSINGGNGGHVFPIEEGRRVVTPHQGGRWPANVIHDGSDEVVGAFPETKSTASMRGERHGSVYGGGKGPEGPNTLRGHNDSGSAARFFYCAKAARKDRGEGNGHPTVKPTDLMRYLCRLVTPPGGTVLDPFMGSGSTGRGAALEGFSFIGIEREAEYLAIAERRIAEARQEAGLFAWAAQ